MLHFEVIAKRNKIKTEPFQMKSERTRRRLNAKITADGATVYIRR